MYDYKIVVLFFSWNFAIKYYFIVIKCIRYKLIQNMEKYKNVFNKNIS